MVIQRARPLVEENKSRRRQHRRVARDHRLGEAEAGLPAIVEQRDKAIRLDARRRAPIGARDETAQQPLRVGAGIVRHDLHESLFERHDALAGVAARVTTIAARHIRQRDATGRPRRNLPQRQMAEKQAVASAGRFVIERTFDLHPAERHGRRAFGSHERIAEIIRPRAVETRGVGHECLVGDEPYFAEIGDRGLRREVEFADAAVGDAVARVDRDRLVAPTWLRTIVVTDILVGLPRRADLVVLAFETHRNSARRHPERVATELDPVAAGDWRAEAVPSIGEAGDVVARDPADRLLVAARGIAQRLASPAHLGLRGGQPDDGKRHAIGRAVEHAAGELTRERALVARIVAHGGRGRPLELHAHRLPDRVVRGSHVARQMNVRDIEGVPDFVVAVRLAILGKLGAHLQPGGRQQIAKGVLVLVAVETAARGAALARRGRLFVGCQRGA